MRALLQPLLLLFARLTDRELARVAQYLRAENAILRAKLPRVVPVTPAERRRLVRLGAAVGAALKGLIAIVSYRTFLRWRQGKRAAKKSSQPGRPRKPQSLRELILRIARETSWGYTRVLGEVRKLTRAKVSRQFVVKVLRENGLDPGPARGEKSWDQFVRTHAATLWQCDFFSTRVLTLSGWREYFLLAFLHVGSRKVFVPPATAHPTAAWVEGQARAFLWHAQAAGLPTGKVFHDRDAKFTAGFNAILAAGGAEVRRNPVRSPNLQAHVERWAQSVRAECLGHFVALGERHLNHLVSEYVAHYHEERPHQGLGNAPLSGAPKAAGEDIPRLRQVCCRSRLGGLLRHYARRAA